MEIESALDVLGLADIDLIIDFVCNFVYAPVLHTYRYTVSYYMGSIFDLTIDERPDKVWNMQLDFLGSTEKLTLSQGVLFDGNFKPVKSKKSPNFSKANEFFQSLSADEIQQYSGYWSSVVPQNDSERFQRYLFAFMSVHTSWLSNVKGYQAIRNWTDWFNTPEKLETLLKGCGVGLHNQRLRFLEQFAKHYWTGLKKFNKLSTESWVDYRNRLESEIEGLGTAKTSFALEMLHPIDCQVVCMDTHLFQLYGLEQKRDKRHYQTIENHWVTMSKMWNVAPFVARCLWWDKNQNKTDSRYWSHALEN